MRTVKMIVVLAIFSLIASAPAMAQKRSKTKIIPIKSFTFTKKAHMNYKRQKARPASFTVNSRGKGVAARGYKLAITSDEKYILIAPKGARFTANAGIDAHPANGGIYWCVCPGYPDDCEWITLGDRDDTEMTIICEGSCECGTVFEPDQFGGIAEYESAGGGY